MIDTIRWHVQERGDNFLPHSGEEGRPGHRLKIPIPASALPAQEPTGSCLPKERHVMMQLQLCGNRWLRSCGPPQRRRRGATGERAPTATCGRCPTALACTPIRSVGDRRLHRPAQLPTPLCRGEPARYRQGGWIGVGQDASRARRGRRRGTAGESSGLRSGCNRKIVATAFISNYTRSSMADYTLPDLPYDYAALEPPTPRAPTPLWSS